jgi:hypothetical protein
METKIENDIKLRKTGNRWRRCCTFEDCYKWPQGLLPRIYCIAHGAPTYRIMCSFTDCKKQVQGKTEFCKKHGGGIRCRIDGCKSSAYGASSDLCAKHGGGNRCQYEDCDKVAQGKTEFCKKHGGGRRCQYLECKNSAREKSDFCVKHGGYKQCKYPKCSSKASGPTNFCFKHGGEGKCQLSNCTSTARKGKLCMRHGGGKRCIYPNCDKGAQRITNFCYKHNTDEFKEERNAKRRQRYKTDINYKILSLLRCRIHVALKGNSKSAKTRKLVGCDIPFLKQYLAEQFDEGMSWENHGEWEIDHIMPCASFDMSDPLQQSECFNYKNLQPLWAEDNNSKSDKIFLE